tara:strand:+ start:1459 stop:1650 length:192 start_codon:yes stop_codon:yes gene_type:complete
MKEAIERLKRDRNVVIRTLKALQTNHEAKRLSTEAFERIRGSMVRELLHIDEVLCSHGESVSE